MKINAETIQKATYIDMVATQDYQSTFEQFLKDGAELVRQTEPNTALWFALKENVTYHTKCPMLSRVNRREPNRRV